MGLLTSSANAPNANFYVEYEAWLEANIVGGIQGTYGLPATLSAVQTNFPFNDTDTGLPYTKTFYLSIGPFIYPLFYQQYIAFAGDPAPWLSIILSAYARQFGIAVPTPLVPTATAPVAPAKPKHAVGGLINDGRGADYMNVSGISGTIPFAIGETVTEDGTGAAPAGTYKLEGFITPWGPEVWWSKVS